MKPKWATPAVRLNRPTRTATMATSSAACTGPVAPWAATIAAAMMAAVEVGEQASWRDVPKRA
jgi:hypothetical protein